MPVLHRSKDGSGFHATAARDGREAVYSLTREGALFLTEILGVRPGDEFRPNDLQLLVDRGWATYIEPEPEPEPEAEPEPVEVKEPAKTRGDGSRAARRTRGREIALQVLYQLEQNPAADPAEIERFVQRRLREPKLQDFARALVAGVQENQARIDALISDVAENWRIDRMAAIDRNILRLGAFEILYRPEVPTKVAINEALELAKRYSTAQSSRFVNGILDRLQAAADAASAAEPEPPTSEPEAT